MVVWLIDFVLIALPINQLCLFSVNLDEINAHHVWTVLWRCSMLIIWRLSLVKRLLQVRILVLVSVLLWQICVLVLLLLLLLLIKILKAERFLGWRRKSFCGWIACVIINISIVHRHNYLLLLRMKLIYQVILELLLIASIFTRLIIVICVCLLVIHLILRIIDFVHMLSILLTQAFRF